MNTLLFQLDVAYNAAVKLPNGACLHFRSLENWVGVEKRCGFVELGYLGLQLLYTRKIGFPGRRRRGSFE